MKVLGVNFFLEHSVVLVLDFVSVVVIVIVLLIYFDLVLVLVIVTKISLLHTVYLNLYRPKL